MKTETRSATENPFIPLHLAERLIPFSVFHISSVTSACTPFAVGRISSIVFSKRTSQADIMEATLARESAHLSPRPSSGDKFTFSDAPTSDSKFKLSPTANTRSRSATSISFVLNSASLPFRTCRILWKNANESQLSPFYGLPIPVY